MVLQNLASQPLDFISRHRTLAEFSAPNMSFLIVTICGLLNQRQQQITYAYGGEKVWRVAGTRSSSHTHPP